MSDFSAKNYATVRFGKAIILLTILCAILAGYWVWNIMAGRAVDRSNLLLITLDTCRKDHSRQDRGRHDLDRSARPRPADGGRHGHALYRHT